MPSWFKNPVVQKPSKSKYEKYPNPKRTKSPSVSKPSVSTDQRNGPVKAAHPTSSSREYSASKPPVSSRKHQMANSRRDKSS
ncbi:hypothetical protein DPV78_002501 [Talaromyces pinophilus]|nr:hypothetical protein DPV78_002501 [Talaromyces pinophilus]